MFNVDFHVEFARSCKVFDKKEKAKKKTVTTERERQDHAFSLNRVFEYGVLTPENGLSICFSTN